LAGSLQDRPRLVDWVVAEAIGDEFSPSHIGILGQSFRLAVPNCRAPSLAIIAELNRIKDSRFLAALQTLIAAAGDYGAYVATR